MDARRSNGYKKGRTSKMHDTNPGGLDRYSEHRGSKVAIERTPAISELIGSNPNFPALIEQLNEETLDLRDEVLSTSMFEEIVGSFKELPWKLLIKNNLKDAQEWSVSPSTPKLEFLSCMASPRGHRASEEPPRSLFYFSRLAVS